jgi:hypothetical protein
MFLESGSVYYDYLLDKNGKFSKMARFNNSRAYELCQKLKLRNEHLMVDSDEKFINVIKSLMIIDNACKRSAYASMIFGRRGYDVMRMLVYLEEKGFDCSYSS